jgi:hypothetical protein
MTTKTSTLLPEVLAPARSSSAVLVLVLSPTLHE